MNQDQIGPHSPDESMIRITKEADYGVLMLAHMAEQTGGEIRTAREIASGCGLPLPMVSKILGALTRAGVVTSHRGASGGYSLSRSAEKTSIAEVIRAIEGPISMVQCGAEPGACDYETGCRTRDIWSRINRSVEEALEQIPISSMLPRSESDDLLTLSD